MLILLLLIVIQSSTIQYTRDTRVGSIGRNCMGAFALLIAVRYVLRTITLFRMLASNRLMADYTISTAKLIPILCLVLLLLTISVLYLIPDSDATYWIIIGFGSILAVIYTIVPILNHNTCYTKYLTTRLVIPMNPGWVTIRDKGCLAVTA
jgi:hypothetical protein